MSKNEGGGVRKDFVRIYIASQQDSACAERALVKRSQTLYLTATRMRYAILAPAQGLVREIRLAYNAQKAFHILFVSKVVCVRKESYTACPCSQTLLSNRASLCVASLPTRYSCLPHCGQLERPLIVGVAAPKILQRLRR